MVIGSDGHTRDCRYRASIWADEKAELAAKQGEPALKQVNLEDVQTSDEYAVKAAEDSFEQADDSGKLHNFFCANFLAGGFHYLL